VRAEYGHLLSTQAAGRNLPFVRIQLDRSRRSDFGHGGKRLGQMVARQGQAQRDNCVVGRQRTRLDRTTMNRVEGRAEKALYSDSGTLPARVLLVSGMKPGFFAKCSAAQSANLGLRCLV
jgi:hypothetical protein